MHGERVQPGKRLKAGIRAELAKLVSSSNAKITHWAVSLWSRRRTLAELGVTVTEGKVPEHELAILEFCDVEYHRMRAKKGGGR